MVSTHFALSSASYSTNPRMRFWEKVGVKASGVAKMIAFLELVRLETVRGLDVPNGIEEILEEMDLGEKIDVLGTAMPMEKVKDLGAVRSLEIVREVAIFGDLSFRVIG
ncbi:peroxiredoxin-2E-2 [Pyrus ussuriensis x Pyrus communis]|uniref:Peroxiredoxin-2E-2 n=1 Tax=Pyrus ussuriensis x Pyrus communis TaxID=2448454 RepID=A0A5N5GPZ7_9ROSA|nr:peroxiredoxin-2E-2 [Pyrus ussuriensis x Pyrus communis]